MTKRLGVRLFSPQPLEQVMREQLRERLGELGSLHLILVDEELLEENLVELAPEPWGGHAVHHLGVGGDLEGLFERLLDFRVAERCNRQRLPGVADLP